MKLEEINRCLKDAGIENYRYEAQILCETFSPATLHGENATGILTDALKKRINGYPLQYIIGKWWFWDCEFEVNENCLIPRPDTEILVEQVIKRMPEGGCFADLCTGSGCVAISVLHSRGDLTATAVEICSPTLSLAQKNAEKNGVADRFFAVQGDVLDESGRLCGRFDAIVSNPPYIRTQVIDTLSREVSYEPKIALDGGEDGLKFYRGIIENYEKSLKPEGFFAFEIGYDQGNDLRLIAKERGFYCEIIRDYGGCDRVAILCRSKNSEFEQNDSDVI